MLFYLAVFNPIQAQSPGLIIEPATGAGKAVLDPDGDGYVSAKTNGVQLGFTVPPNNDVLQSEIPYVAIVKPDPVADVLRGGSGNNTEIVGVDASGNNAVLTYRNATNLFYRFRIDRYSTATLTYCILIDTDQKFGLTGTNADPNAVSGNPGFEIEIDLQANKGVYVYKVDGTTTPVLIAGYPNQTNYQKAFAITNTGGSMDVFYDFYIPLSDLTSIVFSAPTTPTSISTSTPLRYAAVTCMNPFPSIGNQAISDVGGVTTTGSIDNIFTDLINNSVPTVPGSEVLDPSACPVINAVKTSDATISGTTTEAIGTSITVSVYQSNGTTLIGSGTITTTGTNWSVNVSSLTPAVTFASGQIVKAVATAPGKGPSLFSCSTRTVTTCTTKSATTIITSITEPSSGKGYKVTNTSLSGTTFRLYTSGYSLASIANVTNPITTTAANQDANFTCNTGNCFSPVGVYYVTVQQPGECESDFVQICPSGYTQSSAPTISNSSITTSTTSITGNGTSASSLISIYADGVKIATATSSGSSPFAYTAAVSSLSNCQVITAKQVESGKCISVASNSVPVSRTAATPSINSSTCYPSSNATISGTSTEANGTIVTLYTPNSAGSVAGTATVSNGAWSVSGLTLTNNQVFVAKVTSGSCLTPSADSDPMAVSLQTSLAGYTVKVNTPTEGSGSVNGTISGGTYPVTLKVYIDQIQIGSALVISNAGNWSVGSLSSTDLYTGGNIKVSLASGSACESALSSILTTVLCNQPTLPVYTAGSQSYCIGSTGSIAVSSTQTGVVYQLVNGSGIVQGPSQVGNGGTITLSTNILNANLSGLYVKAYNVANSSCAVITTGAINFDVQRLTPTLTFTNTVSVLKGTTSVNLPFSAKSSSPSADLYTVSYSIAAINQGFVNVTTPTSIPVAPGNIVLSVPTNPTLGTYSGTISVSASSGSSCNSTYGFTITVYSVSSPPVISVQPVGTTICSGTGASLSVVANSASTISYQWQSAISYSGTYANVTDGSGANSANYTTANLSGNKYYRVVLTNSATGSTISNVAVVNVNSIPLAAEAIQGNSIVCKGQSLILYNIPEIAGATSYSWNYTGTGATITGNTNSVFVSFSSTATSGTLSVQGVNSCGSGTAANLSISVNGLPAVFNVTGGGTYCSGGGGLPIGLSGSATGVSYQLYLGTNPVGSPVSGSGSAITFGNQTATGNYTVIATNGSGCTSDMNGNASISTTACSADLVISKSASDLSPMVGTDITFTITVTNNGPSDATNVTATDVLASGYAYKSDDSLGAYNSSTGIWSIGSLTNGSSVTIHVVATVKP